jgi:alkylhydroperoxidase family enzyme
MRLRWIAPLFRSDVNAPGGPGEKPKGESIVESMFLPEIEALSVGGPYGERIEALRERGLPVPQIMHLFAFKPEVTEHLAAFTQGVMRGPSPLPPGFRELIAAFTSRRNDCLF